MVDKTPKRFSNTNNGDEHMCSGRVKTSYPTSIVHHGPNVLLNNGNSKITELRTILQRESQNS
jgi:hypothetical protein